jgi:hypothetical protein
MTGDALWSQSDIDKPAFWTHTPIVWTSGSARVITSSNSPYFQYYDEGWLATTATVNDIGGEPVDRVAWAADRPSEWWVENGCEPVLGLDQLDLAHSLDRELRVLATPAEWLKFIQRRDHEPAAVLLDPRANPRFLFRQVKIRATRAVSDHLLACARRHDPMLNIEIVEG